MAPDTKKIRITDYGQEAHVSASALSHLLEQVRRYGLPEHSSRATLQRARHKEAQRSTSFGPLLVKQTFPSSCGGSVDLWFQHPLGWLEVACRESVSFGRLLRQTLDAHGNKLSVIACTDEITPGNPLAEKNQRRIESFYWSVREFGFPALCHEECWFVVTGARSTIVNKLQGGMAELMKHCLKLFFGRPDQADLRSGVHLDIGEDNPRFVVGSLSIVVQDERAHKFGFAVKGVAGHKLCALCQNACSYWSHLLPDSTGFLASSDEVDITKFRPHTHASITGIQMRLKQLAEAGDKQELDNKQVLFGFLYCPTGVLQDRDLDVNLADVWAWDWLHTYFQGGVFTVEARALFTRLAPYRLGGKEFSEYLSHWVWPKGYASGANVCSKRNDFLPSGNASEQQSCAPVIEKFLVSVVGPAGFCEKEVASGISLCIVSRLLSLVNTGVVSAAALGAAISTHLVNLKAAYELEVWLPKTHTTLHLPSQLLRHGCLLSTHLMERKHKLFKRYADDRHNTRGYELGLLEETTVHQLYKLREPIVGDGLVDQLEAKQTLRDAVAACGMCVSPLMPIKTSNSARVQSRVVVVDDVVAYFGADGAVLYGKVQFHIQVGEHVYTCVTQWHAFDSDEISVRCIVQYAPTLIQTRLIIEPCVFRTVPEGTACEVLVPGRLR
eukprot:9503939-Pyramimonas_sp.AAC.2